MDTHGHNYDETIRRIIAPLSYIHSAKPPYNEIDPSRSDYYEGHADICHFGYRIIGCLVVLS